MCCVRRSRAHTAHLFAAQSELGSASYGRSRGIGKILGRKWGWVRFRSNTTRTSRSFFSLLEKHAIKHHDICRMRTSRAHTAHLFAARSELGSPSKWRSRGKGGNPALVGQSHHVPRDRILLCTHDISCKNMICAECTRVVRIQHTCFPPNRSSAARVISDRVESEKS